MRRALRREEGASAVEMALLAPLLFMLVFGIIGFGIGFLQLQSVRAGVREGARAAAVGAPRANVQQIVVDASGQTVPTSQKGNVVVTAPRGNTTCTPNTLGDDVSVSFNTLNLNGGTGIVVQIPLLPDIPFNQTVTAQFRCEV